MLHWSRKFLYKVVTLCYAGYLFVILSTSTAVPPMMMMPAPPFSSKHLEAMAIYQYALIHRDALLVSETNAGSQALESRAEITS